MTRCAMTARRRRMVLTALLYVACSGSRDQQQSEPTRRSGGAGGTPIIVLDTTRPSRGQLLWLDGRGIVLGGGAQLVSDGAAGWIGFDTTLRSTTLPRLLRDHFAATIAIAPDGSIWTMTAAGDLQRVGATSSSPSAILLGDLVSDPLTGAIWVVRSPVRSVFRMPGTPIPLFERHDPGTGRTAAVGTTWMPEDGLMEELANAGTLVVWGDTLFYAPLLRDEVVALTLQGDTLWRFTRGYADVIGQPHFAMTNGRPTPIFSRINRGLARGPQGTLFVLSDAAGDAARGRLDELDPHTGRLLATTSLPSVRATIAVAPDGRVHLLSAPELLAGAPPRQHVLPTEAFPALEDTTMHRLQEWRGQPMILNFWASWCEPCRRELPLLDSLRRVLGREGITVLGMNDDQSPRVARQFLAELAPEFPSLAGRGGFASVFGLVGLPWTILVDREGRIVGQWIGELDHAAVARLAAAARGIVLPPR